MKKLLQPRLFKNTGMLLLLGVSIICNAQPGTKVLSSGDLYSKGFDSYNKNNYKEAAFYLYAYIQKNPSEMSNQTFADAVRKAYEYSEERVMVGAETKGDDPCRCRPVNNNNKPPITTPPAAEIIRGAKVPLKQNRNKLSNPIKRSVTDTSHI